MSYPSLNPKRSIYNKLKATQIVLIHWNQQLMCLHKITVVSGMALWAHFSLGIAKFDTLSNLSLTFVKIPIFMSNYKITQSAILNIKLLTTLIKQSPSTTIYLHGKFFCHFTSLPLLLKERSLQCFNLLQASFHSTHMQ